jgi:hypothetical protein
VKGFGSALAALAGSGHLKLNLRLGKFDLKLWERPGEWASDAELKTLTEELRTVAAAGQKGKPVPEYGVLLGQRADLARRIIAVAYSRPDGRPVGFNALVAMDLEIGVQVQTVLHLGLTYIDPAFQGQALPALLYGAPSFLLFFRGGLRSFWVSNVTQVPAVAGKFAATYAEVYPSPVIPVRQTFTHLALARQIMLKERAAFGVAPEAPYDEARGVILDSYTGGSDELKKTFAEAPKHRDPRVNAWCERELNYDRGDDVLQLGRVSLGAATRFLREKLPDGSVARLSFQAATLLAFGIVIPVIRWLIPAPEVAR